MTATRLTDRNKPANIELRPDRCQHVVWSAILWVWHQCGSAIIKNGKCEKHSKQKSS